VLLGKSWGTSWECIGNILEKNPLPPPPPPQKEKKEPHPTPLVKIVMLKLFIIAFRIG